jgi:predicted enzyme related to lactoylglutathione lyase
VWWSELQTADPARARAFYAAVMGWTPNVVALNDQTRPPAPGEAEYTVFKSGDREVAGAALAETVPDKPVIPFWLTYVQVANVDAAVLKAVELGGKLLEPAADVPNTGRIAIIEDPEGVRVGLMSPLATTSG